MRAMYQTRHTQWVRKSNYIGERSTTFAKGYGIKVRCYGEHVGELIDKLGECIDKVMGTHWEHSGNTHIGNQGKMKKKISHSPILQREKKKARHLECMLGGLPIRCMKFLFPKEFITIIIIIVVVVVVVVVFYFIFAMGHYQQNHYEILPFPSKNHIFKFFYAYII